jgi:hypothetical protein
VCERERACVRAFESARALMSELAVAVIDATSGVCVCVCVMCVCVCVCVCLM